MDNDSARQRLLKTSNLETNKNVKGVEIRQDVAKAVKTEIYHPFLNVYGFKSLGYDNGLI